MGSSTGRNSVLVILSIAVFLGIWKILSLVLGAEIILPSPEKTVLGFFRLLLSTKFWPAFGATIIRGLLGFTISCAAGIVLGITSGLKPGIHAFVKPYLAIIKPTPVMSVILLALIWFKTDNVPIFVSFLIAFPIIFSNVIEGVNQVEEKLIEMSKLYGIKKRTTLFHIYIPSITPYFLAGISSGLGITWKVVIAAEVLSQPVHALGTGLQEAKIQLETAEVFAWTAAAILLSVITEKSLNLLLKKLPWRVF